MIFYVSKGNNEVFFSFLAKKMVKFLHMSEKMSNFVGVKLDIYYGKFN